MNTALAIATFGLVIVTFLYMLYTRRLADETKRMADMMVREFELKISPFIELKLMSRSPSQFNLSLFNRGDIPVTVEKIVFEWWYRGKQDKTWTFELKLDKILSGEEPITISFNYPVEDLVKDEYPESKNMSRGELLRSVAGEIYAYYFNVKREPQRTRAEKILTLL